MTGPTSGAPRRSRFRVLAAAVAFAAALALAGVIGWQLAKGDRAAERPMRRYTIGLPSRRVACLAMGDGLLSASPDGASLVYTLGAQPVSSAPSPRSRPARKREDRGHGRRLWWRFHSPDGQWIGFWSGNEG